MNTAYQLEENDESAYFALNNARREKPIADHLFVNNVRFVSMAAVVLLHCIQGGATLTGISFSGWVMRALQQPPKFGTIGFFLISGFLLEEGMTRRKPLEYLRRRFQKVFLPWMVWFSVYCSMMLVSELASGRVEVASVQGFVAVALASAHTNLLWTPYWFVPNLLIALSVLLLCRRFLFDLRLGSVLLSVSLFYGLNLHANWFAVRSHSEALFGFVFYLWLGAWGARNYALVRAWLENTPMLTLLLLLGLTGAAALYETQMLLNSGSQDTINTLRIGNQAYSVLTVLAIMKLGTKASPDSLDVRATTFGVYLLAPFVLAVLLNVSRRPVAHAIAGLDAVSLAFFSAGLSLVAFALTYGTSLLLTRLLTRRPQLRWLVGGFVPYRGK